MIYSVVEPRLKNRKVLTSPVNDIFDGDILPQLKNSLIGLDVYYESLLYVVCCISIVKTTNT